MDAVCAAAPEQAATAAHNERPAAQERIRERILLGIEYVCNVNLTRAAIENNSTWPRQNGPRDRKKWCFI